MTTTRRVGHSPDVPGAPSSSTHGFLFADLRGYTAFLERRGARAAADLLSRYRTLVREAVARQGGAEIRTEGDSFYVVFPSASAAVACALDIVDAAAHGEGEPIRLGIGVHAGESIETAEGPVGAAVNIAARLCGLAAPGHVLVSDTVRSLTRSVGDALYTYVGRKRLKGVDEPIAVYRAVRGASGAGRTASGAVVRRRASLAASAVALIGVALVVATWRPWVGAVSLAPSSSVTASTPASAESTATEPSVAPTAIAGVFSSSEFAVPFSIQLGRRWERVGETVDVAAYFHREEPLGWLDVVLVAAVLENPCPEAEPVFIGERPEDLIEWLASRPWLVASAPRPYNVGTYRGRSLDIAVSEDATADCPIRTDYVSFFRLGGRDPDQEFGGTWGTDVGERKRIIALDVHGETVMLALGSPYPDVERFWALAEPSLESLRFEPSAEAGS